MPWIFVPAFCSLLLGAARRLSHGGICIFLSHKHKDYFAGADVLSGVFATVGKVKQEVSKVFPHATYL